MNEVATRFNGVRRGMGGAVVVLLVLALVGCADRAATPERAAAPKLVSPASFERRIDEPGVVTINVHVPDEGDIAGTDLRIPYTDIATTTKLPKSRSTPLAVYCRSGNMSAMAVRDLVARGYTDIVELDGGFNAWRDSGRALQVP